MENFKLGLFFDPKSKQWVSLSDIVKELKCYKLNVDLYPHQKSGIEWMLQREREGRGAILADDPGLGKTVQILGLICDSLKRDPEGKTLIVVPQSIIDQWYEEVRNKSNIIDVYQYYGNHSKYIPDRAQVVITTYNTVLWDSKSKAPVLSRIKWHRVICDEAHVIRNTKTKGFEAINSLCKKFGWAVTGTPVMNALKDIYSLVEYCHIPEPVGVVHCRDKRKWIEAMQVADVAGLIRWREQNIIRRTKGILSLPTLYERQIRLRFNEDEKREYLAVTSDAESAFISWARSFNRTIAEYSMILVQILRLRQCCDHRHLKHMSGTSHGVCVLCSEELDTNSKNQSCCEMHPICAECAPQALKDTVKECYICKHIAPTETNLTSTKVEKLFELLKTEASDGKSVIFSQWRGMLDIVEKRCEIEGIKCVRMDGTMNQKQRDENIKKFKNDPDVKVFVLSTKVGGVGLNLTEARYVFAIDPWWNPFVEEQARDRVYRIGQSMEVKMFRFIIEGSIEEWLEMLKEKKRKLSGIIIGDKSFVKGASNGLKQAELQGLFDFLRDHRYAL